MNAGRDFMWIAFQACHLHHGLVGRAQTIVVDATARAENNEGYNQQSEGLTPPEDTLIPFCLKS